MKKGPTLEDLVQVARDDHARSAALEERARAGTLDESDDEEAFIRAALGKQDNATLVDAASRAAGVKTSSVVRAPRRVVAIAAALGSGLALAAALMLAVGSRTAPALPAYTMTVTGMDTSDRGDPNQADALREVSPGAHLVLVARPARPVDGAVVARVFAACGDGALVPADVNVSVAASGAARAEGRPEQFFGQGTRGRCSLAMVLGRDGKLPDRIDRETSRAGLVLQRVDLVVR